jgi:hypothetical protein
MYNENKGLIVGVLGVLIGTTAFLTLPMPMGLVAQITCISVGLVLQHMIGRRS